MFQYKKLSFEQKLRIYACTVSLISLLIMGLAFIAYDVKTARYELIQMLQARADFLGGFTASILATDKNQESTALAYLAQDSTISGAWIYSKELNVSLTYDPQKLKFDSIPTLQKAGDYIERELVIVVRDIYLNKQVVGKVVVVAKSQLDFRIFYRILLMLLACFTSLLIAMIFSARFSEVFTRSLKNLVDTFKKVAEKKDYSIRATEVSEDEDLGMLTDMFNTMLKEVHDRDQALSKNEERLNLALWGSNEILFDWDIEHNYFYFDTNLNRLLGFGIEEFPHTKEGYFSLIHRDDVVVVEERLQRHLSGVLPTFTAEYRLSNREGQWYWVYARGKVVERDKQGRAIRMVGTFMDITVRKESEEKLKLFSKVIESTKEGVLVTDSNFHIVEVNPAFSEITGYSREEIIGKPIDILHSEKQTDEFYRVMKNALKAKGYWQGELWEKRKNGEIYPQQLTINTLVNEINQPIHYVGVFSDITQFRRAEDELNYLTHYDPLTSLPNRTFFMMQLENIMQMMVEENRKMAIVLVGLDNFKVINDSYGHAIGDLVLQNVAKRLLRSIVKKEMVARLAGDEFALVVENILDRREIGRFSEKILNAIGEKLTVHGRDIVLGASIGASIFPEDSTNVHDLFLQADTALYHAKQLGRNSFKLYSPEMNDKLQVKYRLEILLRTALTNQEFTLLYQPKVCAKTGQIVGAEALIRWYNKELGWVSPGEFIPLAEEIGIIGKLDQWTTRAACLQMKKWHDSGYPHLKISVNISAFQLRTSGLVEVIATILKETNLPAQTLDLEFTESVLMDNAERCILLLSVFRKMGITVSMDDFGTGYSSLSYLRRFPIDNLKIDQSFIAHVCTNKQDASIVKAIVAMAKELGLRTIAEGIETKEQMDYLINLGVDEFQGFHFSKPLTPEEFLQRLQQNISQAG